MKIRFAIKIDILTFLKSKLLLRAMSTLNICIILNLRTEMSNVSEMRAV